MVSVNLGRRKAIVVSMWSIRNGMPAQREAEIFFAVLHDQERWHRAGIAHCEEDSDDQRAPEIIDNPDSGLTFRVVLPLAA